MIAMRKILHSAASLLALLLAFSACDDKPLVEPEPNISVNPGSDVEYAQLKLISYNILQGMKYDKENNYDNFVAWMNAQAPDVVAFEETNGFTEETLAELAARWGHSYVTLNPNESGYTVSFTSRYPITVVEKFLDPDRKRGAIHAKILGMNFVVLHLYPYSTWPYGEGAAGTGEDYRVMEISQYLDGTIRKYTDEKDWLMMGDFNCPSPYDVANTPSTWEYRAQNEVLESGYLDLVHEMHNQYITSTHGGYRIDFIFGSRSVAANVISADILKDDFTDVASDHYPVCTVFRYKK